MAPDERRPPRESRPQAGENIMAASFDLVASRLRNMLTRIAAADSGFQELCNRHAELTSDIRRLNTMEDPAHAPRDDEQRRPRTHLQPQMLAIHQPKQPV